jgi:hypothetical protein
LFIKIFFNYLFGYLNITIEGFFVERFINTCANKKIFLWNMKRKKSTILYANITIKDYKRLREITKKTKSKVKIENKKGLPFVLYKYRKRKIFIGFFTIVLIFFITTPPYFGFYHTSLYHYDGKDTVKNMYLKRTFLYTTKRDTILYSIVPLYQVSQ